jgi:hypothetical protein
LTILIFGALSWIRSAALFVNSITTFNKQKHNQILRTLVSVANFIKTSNLWRIWTFNRNEYLITHPTVWDKCWGTQRKDSGLSCMIDMTLDKFKCDVLSLEMNNEKKSTHALLICLIEQNEWMCCIVVPKNNGKRNWRNLIIFNSKFPFDSNDCES